MVPVQKLDTLESKSMLKCFFQPFLANLEATSTGGRNWAAQNLTIYW